MSSDSTIVIDPFDTSALDEETELRALARAIQFSDKFALLFARCNQPQQRRRVIERLQSQLPQLDVQEIHFTEPVTHLLDALRERIRDQRPDVIFVSGLEYSFPVAADAYSTQFVANLNASRNSFSTVIQKPLVLWVPEYALTAIARGAPDFFSIRSGVYFFAATPAETADESHSLTAVGGGWTAWNLSINEKQERIAAIESLLADYEALPPNQRNYIIEMRLHRTLGALLYTQSIYASSRQHYERSLLLAQQLSIPFEEAAVLHGLGNVCLAQHNMEVAESAYQQSLDIVRKLGDRKNQALVIGSLGNIYFFKGQEEKAEEYYKQSLDIYQSRYDHDIETRSLSKLGNLYFSQGKFEEAEKMFQQSLISARKMGSQISESNSLFYLGKIFFQQGRLEETNILYHQSLEIDRRIGNRYGEGLTLYRLALLRKAEGKILEAIEFAQQSVMVFEKMENAQSLENARKLVVSLEQQLQE